MTRIISILNTIYNYTITILVQGEEENIKHIFSLLKYRLADLVQAHCCIGVNEEEVIER